MTKDAVWNTHNVIRLAREAGFEDSDNWTLTSMPWLCSRLETFAKLVHQRGFMEGYTSCDRDNQGMLSLRIDDAVEEEREACAKVCENTFYAPEPEGCGGDDYYYTRPYLHCAELIRARGQA